ncbi:virulence associated lipoprotein [Borrelia turicatae]|uniref:virulence associated lipoprotein n=1 Tax=Borrelia turicatae TaxID=142 RepID=UPI002ED1E7D9
MKHIFDIFIITLILPLLVLFACNPKSGGVKDNQAQTKYNSIQSIEEKLKQHKQESIIFKLKLRAQKHEKMLYAHTHYDWTEDGDEKHRGKSYGDGRTQYGMKNNNQAFGVMQDTLNNYKLNIKYSYSKNKQSRSKIYLAFEYNENLIRNLGEVLNKLAASANNFYTSSKLKSNEYDNLLQEIADEIKEYTHNYFEVAFAELIKKVNKLNILSPNQLQELDQKFDKLTAERQIHIKDAKTIYNDFNNDKDQIKSNAANLKDYINQNYKQKFLTSFAKIKTLANEIKEILDKLDKI